MDVVGQASCEESLACCLSVRANYNVLHVLWCCYCHYFSCCLGRQTCAGLGYMHWSQCCMSPCSLLQRLYPEMACVYYAVLFRQSCCACVCLLPRQVCGSMFQGIDIMQMSGICHIGGRSVIWGMLSWGCMSKISKHPLTLLISFESSCLGFCVDQQRA